MNHLLQEKGFIAPIILLDDAFAHYDNFRTKFLCDYMYHKCHNQFFLTDTTISDHMSQYPDNMIHHLEACLIKKFDTLF